jgi:hypothetical protein
MSPKIAARVLKGSCLIDILILLLIIIIAVAGNNDVGDLFLYWFFFLIFTYIFDFMFVFIAPVRCDNEFCRERMHRAWDDYRLVYECDRCGYIYDTKFKFGGGDFYPPF